MSSIVDPKNPIPSQNPKLHVLLVGGLSSTLGKGIIEALSVQRIFRITSTFNSTPPSNITAFDINQTELDVTDERMVQKAISDIWQSFGPIDVLINNAGILADNFCAVMKNTEWQRVIDTNLTGVFNVCKFVSRKMIPRKSGNIINIASYKGLAGCKGQVNYSASKAGVIALTRSLAREMGRHSIQVNAICPGFIPSKLNQFSKEKTERAKNESLLRIENNLEDTANFVAFLAGGQMSSVTGQVFCIDSRIH